LSIGLLQTKLNKVLAVDKKAYTMRVQPGMRFTELLQEAQKAGMSVQVSLSCNDVLLSAINPSTC
jgi:FAD/FMN-containing dehydrogenase